MPFLGGYVPDPYDSADIPFSSSVTPGDGTNLSTSHPAWLQRIYDQHHSGSCVANATAAAFRFLAHKNNETGTTAAQPHHFEIEISRLFIYYNARQLPYLRANETPQVKDEGTMAREAMKCLKNFGVCSEATWPFIDNPDGTVQHINDKPPEQAYAEATAVHVLQYSRLDPDYPDNEEPNATLTERNRAGAVTLHNLKQCLTEGYPVVFGFNYYWENAPFEKAEDGLQLLPDLLESQRHKEPPKKPNGDSYGGHCVMAIGYDEANQRVLCQNSWGNKWSKDGLFWITYNWITDWEATNDFWTLRIIQTD